MPRAYTIATAALALGVETKWLDNTLSHFVIPGVARRRQGVARKLSIESLVLLSVAVLLGRSLSIPLPRALEISREITAGTGRLAADANLRLTVDLDKLRTELFERLETAVEIAPVPRRGRPPRTTTGRLD